MINQYFYLIERIPKITIQIDEVKSKLEDDIHEIQNKNPAISEWRHLQNELPQLLDFLKDDWFSLSEKKNYRGQRKNNLAKRQPNGQK